MDSPLLDVHPGNVCSSSSSQHTTPQHQLRFVPFFIASASSLDDPFHSKWPQIQRSIGFSVAQASEVMASLPNGTFWMSKKLCIYPQDLDLVLTEPSQLHTLRIQLSSRFLSSKIEVWATSGPSHLRLSMSEAQSADIPTPRIPSFQLLGSQSVSSSSAPYPSSSDITDTFLHFKLDAFVEKIKIRLFAPLESFRNPSAQVGLSAIHLLQSIHHDSDNSSDSDDSITPERSKKSRRQSSKENRVLEGPKTQEEKHLLASLGMLKPTYLGPDSSNPNLSVLYQTVQQLSPEMQVLVQTIFEAKDEAVAQEDYDEAARLRDSLPEVVRLTSMACILEKRKSAAIDPSDEDFELAASLRDELERISIRLEEICARNGKVKQAASGPFVSPYLRQRLDDIDAQNGLPVDEETKREMENLVSKALKFSEEKEKEEVALDDDDDDRLIVLDSSEDDEDDEAEWKSEQAEDEMTEFVKLLRDSLQKGILMERAQKEKERIEQKKEEEKPGAVEAVVPQPPEEEKKPVVVERQPSRAHSRQRKVREDAERIARQEAEFARLEAEKRSQLSELTEKMRRRSISPLNENAEVSPFSKFADIIPPPSNAAMILDMDPDEVDTLLGLTGVARLCVSSQWKERTSGASMLAKALQQRMTTHLPSKSDWTRMLRISTTILKRLLSDRVDAVFLSSADSLVSFIQLFSSLISAPNTKQMIAADAYERSIAHLLDIVIDRLGSQHLRVATASHELIVQIATDPSLLTLSIANAGTHSDSSILRRVVRKPLVIDSTATAAGMGSPSGSSFSSPSASSAAAITLYPPLTEDLVIAGKWRPYVGRCRVIFDILSQSPIHSSSDDSAAFPRQQGNANNKKTAAAGSLGNRPLNAREYMRFVGPGLEHSRPEARNSAFQLSQLMYNRFGDVINSFTVASGASEPLKRALETSFIQLRAEQVAREAEEQELTLGDEFDRSWKEQAGDAMLDEIRRELADIRNMKLELDKQQQQQQQQQEQEQAQDERSFAVNSNMGSEVARIVQENGLDALNSARSVESAVSEEEEPPEPYKEEAVPAVEPKPKEAEPIVEEKAQQPQPQPPNEEEKPMQPSPAPPPPPPPQPVILPPDPRKLESPAPPDMRALSPSPSPPPDAKGEKKQSSSCLVS